MYNVVLRHVYLRFRARGSVCFFRVIINLVESFYRCYPVICSTGYYNFNESVLTSIHSMHFLSQQSTIHNLLDLNSFLFDSNQLEHFKTSHNEITTNWKLAVVNVVYRLKDSARFSKRNCCRRKYVWKLCMNCVCLFATTIHAGMCIHVLGANIIILRQTTNHFYFEPIFLFAYWMRYVCSHSASVRWKAFELLYDHHTNIHRHRHRHT